MRAIGSPFFKVRVTGPDALPQVTVAGDPAVMFWKKAGPLVIWTALASAKAVAARKTLENCILME